MKFSNHEPEPANFQIAPMIDIVFLLLIFFIMTWNVGKQKVEANIEIDLPTAEEGPSTNSYEHSSVIEVYKDGRIKIGLKSYTQKSLKTQLTESQRLHPDKPYTIWADKDATIQQAFTVFNICKEVGLDNVSIAAKEK